MNNLQRCHLQMNGVLSVLLIIGLSGTGAVAMAGRGGIGGTVTDPSGAVIAKVKVTVLAMPPVLPSRVYPVRLACIPLSPSILAFMTSQPP